MQAMKPEDCDRLLFEALKNRDLEALVALYEPDATLIQGDVSVVGHDAIREVMRASIENVEDAQFNGDLQVFPNAQGDLALVRGSWSAMIKSADGTLQKYHANNVEVVRRQPDGTWKFVIDHPNGAD